MPEIDDILQQKRDQTDKERERKLLAGDIVNGFDQVSKKHSQNLASEIKNSFNNMPTGESLKLDGDMFITIKGAQEAANQLQETVQRISTVTSAIINYTERLKQLPAVQTADLTKIIQAIENISLPEMPDSVSVSNLSGLENSIKYLTSYIGNLKSSEIPKEISVENLGSVEKTLKDISSGIQKLLTKDAGTQDLSPLIKQVKAVENAIRNMIFPVSNGISTPLDKNGNVPVSVIGPVTINPIGSLSTNLISVGGNPITLGQTTVANSLPVTQPLDTVVTGTITTTQSVLIPINGQSSVGAIVSSGWSGTILIEASVDGTSFVSTTGVSITTGAQIQSFTGPSGGQIQINAAGFSAIRLRGANVTAGTATVTLRSSMGVSTVMADNPFPVTQSGTWSVRTQDGSGNALTSTANALDVNIKSGSGITGLSTNVAQWGGTNTSLGQKVSASSVPVVVSSDYNLPTVSAQASRQTLAVTANGQSLNVNVSQYSAVTISLTGTYAGVNLKFEISDDGSNFYPTQVTRADTFQTSTTTGSLTNTTVMYNAIVAGVTNFKVTATAYGSGTANVGVTATADPMVFSPTVGISTSANTVAISQATPGTTNLVALTAETTKVIGVVRTADGSGNLLTSTGSALDVNLKTSSITLGVSGTVTANQGTAAAASSRWPVFLTDGTNAQTFNSTTTSSKFGADINILSILGTAPTTAGKLDVKGADGDVFVRQATSSNLNADINLKSIAGTGIVNGGVAGSQSIGGTVATNVAITANPINLGAQAVSSENAAVTTARQVQLVADLVGKLIVLPYANPENFVSGAITSAMTGTTSTSLIAAPASGLRNYITQITVSNSHASVGTDIIIQDGSGGTTLYTIPAASVYGGATVTFPVALRQPTTATAIFCANVTTGSNTKVSATGYKGA